MTQHSNIGEQEFTDGVQRTVYEDDEGRYVEADGERVYGTWLEPDEASADVPLVVPAE
jgi:hypothetical protein